MKLLNENLTFPLGEAAIIRYSTAPGETAPGAALRNDDGFIYDVPAEMYDGCAEYKLGKLPVGLYFLETGQTEYPEQITVYEKKYLPPAFLRRGIIYHIFVDRFFRGKGEVYPHSDSVYDDDWYNGVPQYPAKPGDDIENNRFFGGNLWGITEKLGYISSLGATAIYLSPVFEAYSNHKYDVGDYMKVDGGFGGDEALAELIREAEKLGIAVIMDGVFNHTGDRSRYFDRLGEYGGGACEGAYSAYYDWYDFKNFPDSYACWWGMKNLPSIRGDNSDFRDFICGNAGVIDKYMKMGVAGFRLDVADELDNSLLDAITGAVKKHRPNGCVLGEVWEDASCKTAYGQRRRYFLGDQLDGVMNYPLRNGIIDFLIWKNSVLLKYTVNELLLHYPPECYEFSMCFLGTHDTERIMTVLGGKFAGDMENSELAVTKMNDEEKRYGSAMLKIAYLLLHILGGTVTLYYGDEAGMEGYRDPFNRRPYPWGKENAELVKWFAGLGQMKKRGLLDGLPRLYECDEKSLLCRRGELYAAVNMSDVALTYAVPCGYVDFFSGESTDGKCRVEAQSFRLLHVKD